jgi:transcriptional regulator with XRE-family HTH domain
MNTFGKRLKKQRALKKVSGPVIAKLTGNILTASTLSNIEAGRWGASDQVIDMLASVSDLDLPESTLKAWRLLDRYSAESILQAAKLLILEEQVDAALTPQEVFSALLEKATPEEAALLKQMMEGRG